MRNTLQNFALSLSGREIDACIVAVLSHGRRNEEILGTDGQVVTTSEMRHYFGNQMCPTMAGKPKLFIIQACKGGRSVEIIPIYCPWLLYRIPWFQKI